MRRARLIYNPETANEAYPFVDQCVIGRRHGAVSEGQGRVRIQDPAISSRHCVVRQTSEGKFYVRDESRNGTRVDGRRLVPNVEMEITVGAKIQVGKDHFLVLDAEEETPANLLEAAANDAGGTTRALINTETEVTVLVGDIAGYTTMNQRNPAADVIKPVNRVFAELESVVNDHRGSIKEYQGDAIFAFWELDDADPTWHVVQACHCALALQQRIAELARDAAIWTLRDEPLQMEWALTTGDVIITAIGGDRPIGLAMVGDCVNYAFRLEKLAGPTTGTVLACQHTEERARGAFVFKDLGVHEVKGRTPERVFSLREARPEERTRRLSETESHEPVA